MLALVLSPDEQTQSQIGAYKAMTMTATGMSNDLWNKISLHWYHEAAVLSHPQSKICIDVLTRTEVEMWSENSASSRPLLAFKLVERCSLKDDTDLKWTKTKLAHMQNCLFCFTKLGQIGAFLLPSLLILRKFSKSLETPLLPVHDDFEDTLRTPSFACLL